MPLLLYLSIRRFYYNLLISTARSTDEVIYSQASSCLAISSKRVSCAFSLHTWRFNLTPGILARLTFRQSCRGVTSTTLLMLIGLTIE